MKPRLTIRFVTRKWPPALGGMETYCARLADALAASYQVDIIALPGRADGSPPKSLALIAFALTTLLRLILLAPADVTHIGDMAAWPLALAARLRSRKTIIAISAHGTDVSYPLRGGALATLYGAYLRLGARLLAGSKVIANSRATADEARRYGWTGATIIPLATDMKPPPIGEHGQHILFVGRLTPRKGCRWFIREVLPLLPEDVNLRIAGKIWDNAEAQAFKNSRVTFLGPVYGEMLAREFASALCIIVPTREFEGFGLTAIDGAAAGGVVLASAHSGLNEAIIDGVTGFHLPAGDASAWVKKILDIQAWSEEKRRKFIEKSVSVTQERYSWDRVAQDTAATYLK